MVSQICAHHVQQMKKHEPSAGAGITTGRHLHVSIMKRHKRVLAYPDYNAPSISPRVLYQSRFAGVALLLVAVPVGTVIFHYQRPAAGQPEHHVKPSLLPEECSLVAMTRTNYVVKQGEDLTLEL